MIDIIFQSFQISKFSRNFVKKKAQDRECKIAYMYSWSKGLKFKIFKIQARMLWEKKIQKNSNTAIAKERKMQKKCLKYKNISTNSKLMIHFESFIINIIMLSWYFKASHTFSDDEPIHSKPVSAKIATYFWLNDTTMSINAFTACAIGGF